MAPDRSTRGRRSRRDPEVPGSRIGGRIMGRRGGSCVGKGKREVASSSAATALRYPRSDLMDPIRSPSLLDKSGEEHLTETAFRQTQQQSDVESLTRTLEELPSQISPLSHSLLPSKQPRDLMSEKNVTEPASGQTLHQPVVSSPKNLQYSRRDTIWVREECSWGITFYTRLSIQRYFHTYPYVGGPFRSLEQVRNAIDRYLHDRQDPSMCKERHEFYEVGKASVERGIRACLYWPDGSKRMPFMSEQIDERRCKMLQLVRALMDKYNEDHLLFEDTAFELKDVVGDKVIFDGDCRYYHINFTAKTIGAKTADNLFFAEVIHTEDGKLVVSCTCMVDPSDNGHCYGCRSNMKHPNADAYIGGHSKIYKVCHVGDAGPAPNISTPKTMDDWKAEEARIRRLFEGLDDPSVVARLMEPPKFKFGEIKATDEEVKRFMQSIKAPHHPNCGGTGIIDASTADKFRAALK